MITEVLAKLLSSHDLPESPPASPMPILMDWFAEARSSGRYEDPNAMCLATSTTAGVPSVRVVLCKGIDPDRGSLTFFTNYESRKGRELSENPCAAAVFHWPHAHRQARVEGSVERLSAGESDEYFRSRSLISRIGACISRQSQPIASRAELISKAMALALSTGGEVQRPAHWGGYRLMLELVELWSAQDGRLHQRIEWRRDPSGSSKAWFARLLSP